MTTVTFDTHEFIKRLEAKGFQTEQAEGVTEALKDALTVSEIATKADINELRLEFKAEIASVRAEVAPIKWMAGATIAGVITLIIKAFF
jgi:hypothetical protein